MTSRAWEAGRGEDSRPTSGACRRGHRTPPPRDTSRLHGHRHGEWRRRGQLRDEIDAYDFEIRARVLVGSQKEARGCLREVYSCPVQIH